MLHDQISMFDLFQAQTEEAPPAPAPDAAPVPVRVQASAKCADGSGYRVFGVIRAEIIPSAWRPSPRDVLEMFRVSLSWYMSSGMLDRGDVIDLFAHIVDEEGNARHMEADAHAAFSAAELYDAAESF